MHVRDFLEAAAPEPSQAIDAPALVRAATVPRQRRWLAWLTAGIAAIGASFAAGTQLAPTGQETVIDVRPTPTTTPSPSTTSAFTDPAASTSATSAMSAGAALQPGFGGTAPQSPSSPTASRAQSTSEATTSTTAPWGPWSPPPEPEPGPPPEGCYLDYSEYGPCSYVATQEAGVASGWARWHVRIERGSEVIELDATDDADWCIPIGVVQPGDRVTAWKDDDPTALGAPRGPLAVGPRVGQGCP